jgi:hypothetical protein
MRLLRRFLVLAALMFWQGGFVFYASIVVPIGTQVLGSAAEQGRITRQVTWYLNVSGAAALVLLAWDVAAARPGHGVRWGRGLCWLVMAVALGVLLRLHLYLDSLFIADDLIILDRPTFRYWHRVYLWVSTVQWAAAVLFALLTLAAWRAEDRRSSAPAE